MKRILFSLMAIVIATSVSAQEARVVKAENFVKFKELNYNFGKIKQNIPAKHDFSFSNISEKAVVIESATGSCGCTVPVKPEAPVSKGKSDKITAVFNAAALGPFNKSIYVKIAGVDVPVEIRITGEVLNENDYVKYEKEYVKEKKAAKNGGK